MKLILNPDSEIEVTTEEFEALREIKGGLL